MFTAIFAAAGSMSSFFAHQYWDRSKSGGGGGEGEGGVEGKVVERGGGGERIKSTHND